MFSLNSGKYGPEKFRIWTLFSQCILIKDNLWTLSTAKKKKKMIGWLRQIKQNHWCKFLIFSIKKFYISRDEDRIQKALYFAEANTFISFDDKFITHHAKSLLFNKEETSIKRETGFNDVGKSLRHDLPEQFEKKIFLLVRRVSSFQK